jgi:hypothetical protein
MRTNGSRPVQAPSLKWTGSVAYVVESLDLQVQNPKFKSQLHKKKKKKKLQSM